MSSSEGPPPAAAVPGSVPGSVPGPTAAETPPPQPGTATEPSTPIETAAPADLGSAGDPAPGLSPERIAERVAVLDGMGELPLPEHVSLYQRLHAELQAALDEIDGP